MMICVHRKLPSSILYCLLCVFSVLILRESYSRYAFPGNSGSNRNLFNCSTTIPLVCPSLESAICSKVDHVTTYLPCFKSKLLDSQVACHDSFSCKGNRERKAEKTIANVSRRAFFSALYTDNEFLKAALVLGYFLKKHHPHHNIYMMYFDGGLSDKTICSLRQVGWIPRSVSNIAPPLQGTYPHFINQFTKLILWNMTEFDSIIYLDTDNLVLGNIAHLHELVADPLRTGFEFAAVADNWHGRFAYHFNAGVLVLHPSNTVFNELMRTMRLSGNYYPLMAEQAFLNAFYELRYLQLPVIYNVNLAMYSKFPDVWKIMEPDFRIVHFTLVKPFLNQYNQNYEVPVKLYRTAWNEYNNSVLASQLVKRCV